MTDSTQTTKTQQQLIAEVETLCQRVTELESLPATLFETVTDAILVIDAETRQIIDTNEYAARSYGCQRHDLLALRLDEILAEPEESAAISAQILSAGHLSQMRRVHRRQDGSVFPVEISAKALRLHERWVLVEVIRDVSAQKEVEEALRRSEERFRHLIETAPTAIMLVDERGTIILVNEQVERLFGYGRDELLGMSVEMLVPEESRGVHADYRAAFFNHPDSRPMGHRRDLFGRHKDGTYFWVEIGLSFSASEDRAQVLTFFLDITERKQIEAELRASEAKYRQLVDNSLQGIIIFQEGRVVFANPAMSQVSGYTTEEVIALSPEQTAALIHPDDRERVASNIQRRLAGEAVESQYEFRFMRADGQIRTVEFSAGLTVYKNKPAIQGTYVDITERQQALYAQQVSETRFRALVENSPVGVYMADEQFHLVYANERLAEMIGCSIEELAALDFRSFIAPEDLDRLVDSYVRRRQGEKVPNHYEFEAIRKNGEKRHFEVYIATTVFPDGITRSWGQILDVTERSQAEEALRSSEERLRLITDSLRDMIMQTDEKDIIRYVSPSSLAVMGMSREEMLGTHISDWLARVHPDDQEMMNRIIRERLETDSGPGLRSYRFRDASGQYHWKEHAVSPFQRADGSLAGFTYTVRDIDERIAAEENLRRADERFAKIFHASPVGIALTTVQDGRYLDVNEAFVKLYGFATREALIGQTASALKGWFDQRQTMLQSLPEYGVKGMFEYLFHRQTGEVRDVLMGAEIIELAGENHILFTFQDITDRKQAEKALAESELRYRVISELVSDTAYFYRIQADGSWRIEWLIGSSEEEVGYEEGEMSRAVRPYHPDDDQRADEDVRLTLTGVATEGDYRMVRQDGQVIWLHIRRQPVWDTQANRFVGFYAASQDITDRKQAEEELERHRQHLEELVEQRTAELQAANARLTALSQVKDEFVSNVSHELRTPISSLMMRQYLLRKSPERLAEHLDVMERETERLRRIIEDLLQLSRLDQKRTTMTLVAIDINQVVKRYVSDRMLAAAAQEVSLSYQAEATALRVLVDEGLIEQALGILLTNAMNYTQPGGAIDVATVTQTDAGRRWVGFRVIDNGPGISPSEQPRLFERFFRGQSGRESGTEGTGLGLAIAKEIIDRHSGRIEVESSGVAGEGTCFTVWIPAHEA